MVADGAVELNLIGQETSGYGRDIEGGPSLAGLLRELEQLSDLEWVRVLYSHPATMTDEIVEAMGQCRKVAPYLDLPLQHISDPILAAMGRRVTRAQTERLLERLREAMPEVALRTTVIVGFPGETPEQFEEMLAFIRAARFACLGAFVYSPEEGTAAAKLPGRVEPEEAQRRYEAVMLTQQEVAFAEADKLLGRELPCLVTDVLSAEEAAELGLAGEAVWLVGRLDRQAPEIDPVTYVASRPGQEVEAGIMPVRMRGRMGYDLVAELVR
jgi:ribosomal protein S12 methylthiotransferase